VKIYDCFTFFNELDLLDMRLNILDSYVDYFVLVEANQTFTGKEKELIFQENKSRYESFLHKIIYVCVNDLPATDNPWIREYHQRNAIVRGLTNCGDDDIILVSDCDEIPNPAFVKLLKARGLSTITTIPMFFCYFYMNLLNTTCPLWHRAKACRYSYLKNSTPQKVRMKLFPLKVAKSAEENKIVYLGWHLSYIGGTEKIKEKIAAFAHQEYNTEEFTDSAYIEQVIACGADLFGRGYTFKAMDEKLFLSEYINENYKNYIFGFDTLSDKEKVQNNEILKKFYSLSAIGILYMRLRTIVLNRIKKMDSNADEVLHEEKREI